MDAMDAMDAMDKLEIIVINSCCGSGYKFIKQLLNYCKTNKIEYTYQQIKGNHTMAKSKLTDLERGKLKRIQYVFINNEKYQLGKWQDYFENRAKFLSNIECKSLEAQENNCGE